MLKRVRRIGGLMIGILFLAAFPAAIRAHAAPIENPDIQISVEGGFNGIAKLGAWTPMHVKVLSSREDITGEIQVEVKMDPGRKVLVSVPVALIMGNEQEVNFEIPILSAYKELNIKLVEKKKTVSEKAYSFNRMLPPEVMLVGILSDDPDAFRWLNGNTIPVFQGGDVDEKMKAMAASGRVSGLSVAVPAPGAGNDVYQKREAVEVPLNRDTFPQNENVMDGFDYLIVSRFDTALLSGKQTDTMEEWVKTGGNLILGTGLHWQEVYHGLPDSLKPFAVTGTKDADCTQTFDAYTAKSSDTMLMTLAAGVLGFEYIPHAAASGSDQPVYNINYFDNDILAGDEENPLVIKYSKEMGNVLVYTFDPASEPFVSWPYKNIFWENVLKNMGGGFNRFYNRGDGYYFKQINNSIFQNIATNVPNDKKPPFNLMFFGLLAYVILAGPVLYLILKKTDKRDLAWVLIPVLAVVFLSAMYLEGFKSRYHSAVMNTVSLIEINPEGLTATVTSSIGLFNDKRGTMKVVYNEDSGIQPPVMQNDNYMYRGGSSGQSEGKVVGKYTLTNPAVFEEYDVMLWTPLMLNAGKVIPFEGNLLQDIGMHDGKLTGSIVNKSLYDLLDAVVLVGNNIIPVGDILAGDTQILDIPFDGDKVHKRPDEYLDAAFGKAYYNNMKDAPPDYPDLLRRRILYESYLNQQFNMSAGRNRFMLLARNGQEIDYGVVVNDKDPQQYYQNLIVTQQDFEFTPGRQVEFPGGIIMPSFGSSNKVGYMEGTDGIRVQETGDLDFQFNLPAELDVEEMDFSVDTYIPLYVRYNMESNNNIGILTNQYEYYLYNTVAKTWDPISAEEKVTDEPSKYIGEGNEVLLRVRVVKLGEPDREVQSGSSYQQELLSLPEIRLKGVAR